MKTPTHPWSHKSTSVTFGIPKAIISGSAAAFMWLSYVHFCSRALILWMGQLLALLTASYPSAATEKQKNSLLKLQPQTQH